MALTTARRAIEKGFDRGMSDDERLFLYLPFEHSENLADQERCVALFADFVEADKLDFAERHKAIIARFGRFPHRNSTLERTSTAEETAFLKEPDSSF